MSYKYYKYPTDIKFKTKNKHAQMMEIFDWLWRNIGCSKNGLYERVFMREWKLAYYTKQDWHDEANMLRDVWIPMDNWTTRNCNFGKMRFYFKDELDAMAFKLRWS